MKQALGYILICVVSVLASLHSFEYYLWLVEYKDSVRGSFNEALQLRADGEKTFPLLLPASYAQLHPEAQFIPLAGPSRVEMLGANESGFWPRFKTDEFGFNNPSGAHGASPDILLIGDSFTQGVTVRNSDNVAGQLTKSGWRVVNLGQGGSGPLFELAILRQYGLRLHPRHVVWMFFGGNDFADLDFERTLSKLWSPPPDSNEKGLIERRDLTDQLWDSYLSTKIKQVPDIKRTDFLRFLRLARTRTLVLSTLSMPAPSRVSGELVSLLISIVATARNESEAVGCRFTFVYLPVPSSWPSVHKTVYKKDWEATKRLLGASGVSIVDFDVDIQRHPDPSSLWYKGGHLNPAGYALLAQSIAETLGR
jgi:lysophospholipase L1-like esterase